MIIKESNRMTTTRSLFSVFGNSEPTATASLAYIVARFPEVAGAIIHRIVPRIRVKFEELQIDKERFERSSGRTDVEIRGKSLHMILEGKIGSVVPPFEQVISYVKSRLNGHQQYKKLVFLVNNVREAKTAVKTYQDRDARCKGKLATLSWAEIQKEIARVIRKGLNPNDFLLHEFWNYLNREVRMKSF